MREELLWPVKSIHGDRVLLKFSLIAFYSIYLMAANPNQSWLASTEILFRLHHCSGFYGIASTSCVRNTATSWAWKKVQPMPGPLRRLPEQRLKSRINPKISTAIALFHYQVAVSSVFYKYLSLCLFSPLPMSRVIEPLVFILNLRVVPACYNIPSGQKPGANNSTAWLDY